MSKRAVYLAVVDFWETNHYGPSTRDLCELTGLGKGTVQWHTKALVDEGHLEVAAGISRSLRPRVMVVSFPPLAESRQGQELHPEAQARAKEFLERLGF